MNLSESDGVEDLVVSIDNQTDPNTKQEQGPEVINIIDSDDDDFLIRVHY